MRRYSSRYAMCQSPDEQPTTHIRQWHVQRAKKEGLQDNMFAALIAVDHGIDHDSSETDKILLSHRTPPELHIASARVETVMHFKSASE